jgi:hypothetical protein
MRTKKQSAIRSINPEWWLLLSLFTVSAAVAFIPFGGRMLLFLYVLPIMIAAFVYGKRHTILTSIACVLMVVTGTFCKDTIMAVDVKTAMSLTHWGDLLLWSVMILGFGWALGWLFGDVRQTHNGFVDIMRYMVGRDNERHNYVRRLSYVAGAVAIEIGLTGDQIEVIRRAALLRDIGQLDLSRDTFRRFSTICQDEEGTQTGPALVQVSLGEVMDLVLAEKIFGSKFERQPMGARILALAAEYDDLTSSKRRRSALPPSVAKTMIERESGKRFDPAVVRAFMRAFDHGAFSPAVRDMGMAAGN